MALALEPGTHDRTTSTHEACDCGDPDDFYGSTTGTPVHCRCGGHVHWTFGRTVDGREVHFAHCTVTDDTVYEEIIG